MKFEKSCGAVVFTRENNSIRYVIIESKSGIFGFPKGHMEGSETEEATALREVKEEVGISVSLISGFCREDTHKFIDRNGTEIVKNVVYFLGEYSGQKPEANTNELNGIHLMSFNEAMSVLQFDGSKRILKSANDLLFEGCI